MSSTQSLLRQVTASETSGKAGVYTVFLMGIFLLLYIQYTFTISKAVMTTTLYRWLMCIYRANEISVSIYYVQIQKEDLYMTVVTNAKKKIIGW